MKPHACWLRVSSILLLCILGGPSRLVYSHQNSSLEKHDDGVRSTQCHTSASPCASCCNTQRVQVKFSTRIVENEYIVAFKGYYKPHTRENYIGAALNSSGIRNWKILSRDNLASGFPSDFDVVLLEETAKYHGLNALNDHPLIRRVTPQRLVHRSLKFINTTQGDDPDLSEYRNFKRKVNNYVSSQIIEILILRS